MATPYMNLTLPTEGGDAGTWDTILNDALEAIDAHNHTTGNGRPIPSAGIGINADLTIAGYRLTNVDGVSMVNRGALLSSGACEFFAYGGNAYFRSAGGLNVQITNGGALNMTTVGGIAGDYTSVSAEVAYSDAADSYTFKQQVGTGVRQYARMGSADVRLYEYKAHPTAGPPTNFVGLASPTGLAASYTLTMPAALPAATRPVQVSAAGVVTAGGSIALGSGESITLTGSGRFKRTGATMSIALVPGLQSGVNVAYDSTNHYIASTGVGTYVVSVPIRDNITITQIDTEVYGDGACLITVDAFKLDAAGVFYAASSSSTPAAAYSTQTINAATLAANWLSGQTFTGYSTLEFRFTFGAANGRVSRVKVTYDEV